jgi:RNA polymerase sigma factor (sigma-70 family)
LSRAEDPSPKLCLVKPGSGDQGAVNLASAANAALLGAVAPAGLGVFHGGEVAREVDPLAADRALVRALRAREASAGERLYDLLIGTLDRVITRILGPDQPEHDDLVQATFEELVTTLAAGRFRHECSLKSFAGSIASHLALNAIRSRRRERAVFDKGRAYDDDGIEAPISARTEREIDGRRKLDRLRVELAAMSAERAQALVLHHVLGHDLNEVARILDISMAAAQSRVVRARRELQERMDEALGGDDV